MFTFNRFGPMGNLFTELSTGVWEALEAAYAARNAEFGAPNARTFVERQMTPGGVMLDRLMALQAHFGLETDDLMKTWPLLARCFAPQPTPLQQLVADQGNLVKRAEFNTLRQRVLLQPGIQALRMQLNPVSYGPFTEPQLDYLARHHRSTVEVGAGSATAVAAFRAAGIDAIGLEPGNYQIAVWTPGAEEPQRIEITQAFDWTRDLLAAGHLLKASVEALTAEMAKRTLVISWPEGGSKFPQEAVSRYRELGGARLLFKIGGFIGRHESPDPGYVPPRNPGKNIWAFFEELAKYWGPPRQQVPYEPKLFENDLWEFERIPTPRTLWWEAPAPATQKSPKQRAAERKKKRK